MLKDTAYINLQDTVSDLLLCHRSILDILSKNQECNARLNRSIIKAVTSCGCVQINASKKDIPGEASLADLKELLESHLNGKICPACRETVETEVGKTLFYLAALCNLLDIDLYDVVIKEQKHLKTLGIYNLA